MTASEDRRATAYHRAFLLVVVIAGSVAAASLVADVADEWGLAAVGAVQ